MLTNNEKETTVSTWHGFQCNFEEFQIFKHREKTNLILNIPPT